MANVLIVEDDAIAAKALSGILRRAEHPCAVVNSPGQARRFIQNNLLTDLVILELKLKEGKGIQFLENRGDLLKRIPVVIYTKVAQREVVRYALGLGIQNYLIKPYNDELIYREIQKINSMDWRDSLFEDAATYCKQMGLGLDEFKAKRLELLKSLQPAYDKINSSLSDDNFSLVGQILDVLLVKTEECGFWGLYDILSTMRKAVEEEQRGVLETQLEDYKLARLLFQQYLHPEEVSLSFQADSYDEADPEEKAQIERWMGKDALSRAPIVRWEEVAKEALKLDGFPVVDSVAANFKMAASGSVLNVDNITAIVKEDPGLTAQILRVANQIRHKENDEDAPIEEPRQAVQLIGGGRIKGIASSLKGIRESLLYHPPFTWPSFWMHQMGVAHLTQNICDQLDLPRLKAVAYWSGLIHDAGKLVLAGLYPYGWQAVLKRVTEAGVPLMEAQETYFDCNHVRVAGLIAEKASLPSTFTMALRYHLEPWKAPEHKELCALVGLAKFFCRRYEIGYAGEHPPDKDVPIEELQLWQEVLAAEVFPGFSAQKFEAQVKSVAARVKDQLAGRL